MSLFTQKGREFSLQRADSLREAFPESSEIVDFYRQILAYQQAVTEGVGHLSVDVEEMEARIREGEVGLKAGMIDWSKYHQYLDDLLEVCSRQGSDLIKEGATSLRGMPQEASQHLIEEFLSGRGGESNDLVRFFLLSFLQPLTASLSKGIRFQKEQWLRNYCPICGFFPSVSYLADAEEGEGARFLRCLLCATDWMYNRTQCVQCGTADDRSLDYFSDEKKPYLLLQVCRECHTYIKLIDLRKEGFAVPEYEDIASVSYDLWAEEMGFAKFCKNPLGY